MAVGSHKDETTVEKWDSSCTSSTDESAQSQRALKENRIRINTGEYFSRQCRTFELPCHITVRYVAKYAILSATV
jgi:hypothetical protein